MNYRKQRFAFNYLATQNAAESARRSGYNAQSGTRLARDPEVLQIVRDIVAQEAMSAREVLEEMSAIARVPLVEDTAGQSGLITRMTVGDKLRALEGLGKHHGLWDVKTDTGEDTLRIIFDAELEPKQQLPPKVIVIEE